MTTMPLPRSMKSLAYIVLTFDVRGKHVGMMRNDRLSLSPFSSGGCDAVSSRCKLDPHFFDNPTSSRMATRRNCTCNAVDESDRVIRTVVRCRRRQIKEMLDVSSSARFDRYEDL